MAIISLKKDRFPLLLLCLLHLAGYVAAVFIWKRPYSYDSTEYIQLAANLKNGIYYSGNAHLPWQEYLQTLRPPVYSFFILLCWSLFGYATWAILLVQNLISIFNCFLVRSLFRTLYPQQRKEWLYWLLVCCFPMQVVFANMVFCDILFQCFLMLYMRQALLIRKDGNPRRILYMSLWLIAGVFTKPILYPLLFLQAGAVLAYCIRIKKIKWFFAGVLPLCCILLYGFWNKRETGLYHISSVQSLNLLEYNLKEYYLFRYGPEATRVKMDEIGRQLAGAQGFRKRYTLSAAIATQKIREDLAGYGLFHLMKSVQLFFDPNKLELDIFTRQFHYINNYQDSFFASWRRAGLKGAWDYLQGYPFLPLLLLTPVFGLLRVAGLLLFLCNKRNDRYIRTVLTLFIAYFALITGPVANARYFLPLVLLTSACAWTGWAQRAERRKQQKQNSVAIR